MFVLLSIDCLSLWKKIPNEILKTIQPNFSYFLVYGCMAYVQIPDLERGKVSIREYVCAFIEYAFKRKTKVILLLIEKVILLSKTATRISNKM